MTRHPIQSNPIQSRLDGEKLSQSKCDDVGDLVNIGVICYLKQLLETGGWVGGTGGLLGGTLRCMPP